MGSTTAAGSEPAQRTAVHAPGFERYIGIDYSGAGTSGCPLPGLRVYAALGERPPAEQRPAHRGHWTRSGLAGWLIEQLRGGPRTLVGIDHGLSFPLPYFERHGLALDWPEFLDDFCAHWPTDEAGVRVEHVRTGTVGHADARGGDARWRRLAERRCRAKSVFHFDVPGSVAKSTHAGLPWIRRIRAERTLAAGARARARFWPFDGWMLSPGASMIAEAYPSLWSRELPREARSADQHDAWTVAAQLQRADLDGTLARWLQPQLSDAERAIARVEGWILGVL
jgi:hypothetical protein